MSRALNTAVSGLQAAQMGLTVTGHNISNVYTEGYTRQRNETTTYSPQAVGQGANGTMQIGLGVSCTGVHQIRNEFLDRTYRTEISTGGYYDSLTNAGLEIENILGELQGEYNLQSVFQDVWDSLNELSMNPESLASRGTFISACLTFIDKVNDVADSLYDYQKNLNDQIIEQVATINSLANTIYELNELIAYSEAMGDNANDYRDLRNNALDELSAIVDTDYKELPDGRITVQIEGQELVRIGGVNNLGLKYTVGGNSFVEPVFTSQTTILAADTEYVYSALFDYTQTVGVSTSSDSGSLKGLIVARGMTTANYTSTGEIIVPEGLDDKQAEEYRVRMEFNIEQCLIPQVQAQLDTLVNAMVTVINEAFAPTKQVAVTDDNGDPVFDDDGNQVYTTVWDEENAPYDLNGEKSNTQVFVREYYDTFDVYGNYYEEYIDPDDPEAVKSLYTIGNIMVNPDFLSSDGGYNLLGTSITGDIGDNTLILDLMETWKSAFVQLTPGADEDTFSVDNAYSSLVNDIALKTSEYYSYYTAQANLVLQTGNDRLSYSGVSMDEELSSMMIYQHAYNAASRMIMTIDGMLETVITMKR